MPIRIESDSLFGYILAGVGCLILIIIVLSVVIWILLPLVR